MISVAMLGGGGQAGEYYLDRAAECEPEYYSAEQESPGRWVGPGAAALRLEGPVTGEAGRASFAGLLAGRLPDGTQVMSPVWRSDPRGVLPARGLVRELTRVATEQGVDVAGLFADSTLAATAVELVARQERTGGRDVTANARTLADVAVGAGLNPYTIYPSDRQGKGGIGAALGFAGQQVDVRRSGLDVVVSAPKSVSVLHGLGSPALASVVATAHERAVKEAFGYLDRHASHGLRGHQGGTSRAVRVATSGLVAATFTHHTSRADDPQLHTHLVIANLVHGDDGKWSAVDSRAVHRHARTAGCIYQAVLRGELTRELGVAWGPIHKGVAEIAGVPTAVLRAFSTRRRDIETELDRTGGSSRKAAQRAAYRTRPTKSHIPGRSLHAGWLERLHQLGIDPSALIADVLDRQRSPSLPAQAEVAQQLFGPAGLTERTTSFDQRDVISALTETLPVGLPITGLQLEAAADQMLADAEAIRLLQPASTADDGPRFSTRELLATEQAALALAARPTRVPVHDARSAEAVAAAPGLSPEQRQLVVALLTSPATVDVVAGPAGSGKTAMLRAAAAGWRDSGVPVVGCSLAAVTARRLEAATGIASSSVTRLLADVERHATVAGRSTGLAHGTVVVVDEASMVGTRQLTRLTRHVADAGGKLVLVGDPAQLPEIDAGGLFAAFARHAQPLALSGNQRQHHSWERDALLALRDGAASSALDAYFAHDRIRIGIDAADARQRLVHDYVRYRAASTDPFAVIALASTRDDVESLNREIRAELQRHGVVSADNSRGTATDRPSFATGDVVLVTRNDNAQRLLNGTRALVTKASTAGLVLHTDSGRSVAVTAAWVGEHLQHGYALTVHKAQGLTSDTALVYGTAALGQQAGYVALSRGRVENHLYTSSASLTVERTDVDVPRFQILDRDHPDVRDALAERLSHRRRQVLASEQSPYGVGNDVHRRLPDDRQRQRGRDDLGLSL